MPTSPGPSSLPVVVDDVRDPEYRPADRSRPFPPLGRGDEGHAVALGAGVELVEDRAPPGEHRLLHRHRARRAAVDAEHHARLVVALAHIGRQLQHAAEHRGHPLRVRDAVVLDELQRPLGIESLHHHDRAAGAVGRQAPVERSRVVERAGREPHRVGVEPVQVAVRREVAGHRPRRLEGQRLADPLGQSGRARRVEHLAPRDFRLHRACRRAVAGVFVLREPVEGSAHGETHAQPRQPVADPGRRGQARGRDQRDRAAVVDDVVELGTGEQRADRRVVEAGPLRGPHDLEVRELVLEEDRHVVAGAQPRGVEELRELVRPHVELRVRERRAARAHDHCRLVAVARGVRRRVVLAVAHRFMRSRWSSPRTPRARGSHPARGSTASRRRGRPRSRRAGRGRRASAAGTGS